MVSSVSRNRLHLYAKTKESVMCTFKLGLNAYSLKEYFEYYLNCKNSEKQKIALIRLRLCLHHLKIERGIFNNINENDRNCQVYNTGFD